MIKGLKPKPSRRTKHFLASRMKKVSKLNTSTTWFYSFSRFTKKHQNLRRSSFLSFLRKRNRLKYFYGAKLFLNLYLARLFEFPSRRALYQFKKYLKNKKCRLGYFKQYFLLRLDLFI
jgi:hypothetical protein